MITHFRHDSKSSDGERERNQKTVIAAIMCKLLMIIKVTKEMKSTQVCLTMDHNYKYSY